MSMDATKIPKLTFLLVFLALILKTKCDMPLPPPLCITQFALVNRACAMLPHMSLPPPSPPSSPPLLDDDGQNHGNRHRHGPEREHRQEHGHDHGHRHEHGHRHGHRHAHMHEYRYQESPVQQDCCHWVKEVDAECVCGVLDQLPPSLTRPVHNYTVIVTESCSVTYECGGRLWV
ncbi:hypothetical protein LOK49_LG15G00431 [Camellia lanceoleosa]|uniref:Uncharacterized protein n=1 Tax=Camellia lanceoleosa TaxID=1840588 RepID=A0ACC0F7S7_9ERIC|nr:hypothetical protein LOK49_LG15G00431 [Camellia lanceoleosa]